MPHSVESDNDGDEGYPIVIDTDSEVESDDDDDVKITSLSASFQNVDQGRQEGGDEEVDENDGCATGDEQDDDHVAVDVEELMEVTTIGRIGIKLEHDDDDAKDSNSMHQKGSSSSGRIGGSRGRALNETIDHEPILDSVTAAAATRSRSARTAADLKKWNEIESMNGITKSPYEAPECAEVGESWFERLKYVLTPVVVDGEDEISPDLVRPCGEKLASSMFTAYQQIGKSGVLFSPTWVEGKIRDVECGWLPKKQLLLCLHEHRFLKADERVLQAIVHSLQTWKLVKAALKAWGLVDAFLNLSVNNLSAYNTRKSDCYKCEIFVARAFSINDILRIDPTVPDESLMTKIKACLSIMSRHVKANPVKLAQRQQALEERKKRRAKASSKTTGLDRNGSDSDDQGQTQGRTKGPLREIVVTLDNGSGGSGSAANESAVTSDSHPMASSGSNKKRERDDDQESLLVMLGIVQEQHARMGQTIAFLRSRIEENINHSREEVMKEGDINERELKLHRNSKRRGHKN
jgi:hypothetical protein